VLWVGLTAFHTDADKPALAAARLGVMFCTYLALIFPMGLKGVHMAGRDLGFHLPRTSTWRALATFMPMFALGAVMWMVGGGATTALVVGLVAGFVLSAGAMWLLFRLQPGEVPAAAGYAGGMVALAIGIAAGVLIGLNALLSTALVSMHKQDALSGSPFGVGFTWPKPAEIVPPPKPAIVKATPPVPTPPVTPAPAPEPTPAPEPQANVTPTPEPAPEPAPTPAPAPNQTSNPETTALFSPDKKSPLFHDPLLGDTPLFEGNKSPLVESAALAPIEDSFASILYPARPSPWAVLLRRGNNMGQMDRIWMGPGDPPEGITPWKTVASVPYVPEAQQQLDKYALSPNGELLAHVSKFPTLSVLVYSFKEKRVVETLKLQETAGEAEMFEFLSDDRLMVHRSKNGLDGYEVWDIKTNTRIKAFETPHTNGECVKPALSSDGSLMALVAPDTDRSGQTIPTIFVFELPLGINHKLPVADLGAGANSKTTGLAFSPDGTKISVLFEQPPNGLLVVFRSKGMVKPLISQPMLVPAHPDGKFEGSSIIWLAEDTLLLYGRGILSGTTGAALADLGTVGVAAQRFSKPDLCQFDLPAQQPERGIALVKLKMADIAKLQAK
jgi:hypothetical protein